MARGAFFVGRVGDGKMQVAISLIQAHVLHVRLADTKQLQLVSRAGRVKVRVGILGPLQHGAHGNVLGSSFRQRHVLGCRAVLLRNRSLRVAAADIPAAARDRDWEEYSDGK